ncbi:hypothetical protein BKA80DRAFT_318852 [Phyllosticta citrichinensis]
MANNQLTSQPLGAHRGLLWQFLVECLVCGILTVFFLFYFNRLFATLVSYGIRAYTWHTFRAYIDIESLQISLLGGRLFWKDIRYHGHNQTILIHGGYLTWRFWYGRVKQTEIFDRGRVTPKPGQLHTSSTGDSASRERSHSEAKAEEGGKQKIKELPCRISIKVSGVEAFLYNRTPAYDSIVENFTRATGTAKSTPSPGCDVPVSQQSTYAPTTFSDKVQSVLHRRNTNSSKQKSTSRVGTAHGEPPKSPSEAGEVKKPPEIPSYLRLLPVRIDCNKAAVVMGNESTPSVLVAKCDKASGEITAAHAGPLDLYKQVFNLDFDKPTVHMKPNPDYKNPQLATAARLKRHGQDDAIPGISKKERRTSLWRRAFTPVQNLFYHFNSSQESLANSRKPTKNRAPPAQPPFPGQGRWQGLTRYLDDDDHNEHDEWDGVEYAKFSLIADCSRLSLSLYWDVPGIVPKLSTDFERQASFNTLDINGSLPPEYGLDLHVYEAMLHYGPWADRHRVILQNYFFPALFTDSMPAKPLAPGDTRVATVFKIFVSLEEQCVLRIPLREQSKDWKWKGRAHTVAGSSRNASSANGRTKSRKKYSRAANRDAGSTAQNVRPFGWLDIVVEANSTVNYIMDMVAGPQGFTNSLDVDLRGTESFSSVNHDLLWKSGPVEMDCNLSNPLKWNALRQWGFNMRFNDMDLFLLRDHMFLVTDLINDWGSGPPSEYYTFTPFKYFLNMDFQNLRLYLNTNDSNIINNPADLEDNHFILFHGKNLGVHLGIPLEKFQPIENCITFDARGDEISLDLSLPPGNTAASFLKDKHLADLKELTVLGSYDYFSETALGLTDRLHLDVRGSSLVLTMYGFLIKHFMTFKDNYFGEDMHFKTLEEFRELPQSNGAEAPPVNSAEQAASKSNDLDVILSIEANDSSVLLPANLYTAEDHTRVDVPFFHQDLRVTNYYMDLAMDFSPLSASLGVTNAKEGTGVDNSQTQLYVSMIKLHGHHTFGLPPAEPSYLCGWEFNIGSVTGECSAMLLDKFAGFGRCFAFCLDDDENALPLVNSAIIHDVNFFRIKTNAVSMWLHVAQEAFLIRADPISVDFNDWARSTFSQRLNVLIPNLVIACVDSRTASRQRNRSGTAKVEPQAYLQTDIRLSMLKRKLHFTDDRRAQQAHNAVVFNDVSNKTFDENFSHTSFLVSFEPGIRALITPNAVSTVVNLIDVLQPRHPRDILDDFQMTIMGKIMDLQNLIDGKGSSTECNLRLPSFQLRFVSSIPPLNGEKMNTGKDQYDLVLDHLAVSVRDKKWPKQEGDKKKHTDRTGNDVAVSAELTELLVWLVAGTSASVNVRFKDMDIATSSKHVQYLASLIHRTALLADEIGTKFAELVAKSQRRLRYLAYALTLAGKDIPDPAFITRPSYAIRAANSHLRNHDSWKIISRLHYVYDSLSSEVRQDIIDRCMRGHSMCPPDAENCVIAAWDQWRTWDLAHVRKSLAMRELYGSTPDFSDAQEKKPMRIDASFRTGAIRLIVDPGPEQSDVLFQLLSIDVALSPPAPPTGLMLHEAQRASVVEVSTKNVAITISWEICALVENVIRLFQSDAPQARRADKNDSLDISPHFEDTPVAHKFQVVFATDTGSIAIDTINLRYQSTINAMKLSVVGTDKTAMKEGVSVSALVHSNAAGSELRSRGRLLMRTQVVRPSIFVSHDDADWRQTTPEGWLIIGKSGELSIKVVEDVLGILEVANSVICDEVAYFAGQVESFKTTKVESPRTPEKKDTAILPNITVALLMDSYRIEIALLQSLSYVISGKIGRVSIAPLFDKDPTLTVNFDVDRQSHCLHNHKKRQSQIVAAFTLPLQNGTLTMVHSRTGLKIGFNCIMDTFIIEASAVHGLLLAINEPEVMNVLSTIKDDIEVLQTNAKEALPQTKPEKAPALEQKEDMSVAFDANFVMAGIGILARAPTKLPDSSNATIAFELNRIQVKATNIGPDNELLPLPEFSALLPHISLSCQLSDGDNIKDCGNLFFGLELRGTLQGGTWKIPKRNYRVRSTGLEVNIFADTASAAVEVLNHLQERIKGLDLSRERRYLRKLRQPRRRPSHKTLGDGNDTEEVDQMAASGLFTTAASLELSDIQISWIVGNSVSAYPGRERNDLVLSFKRIELATRSEETARLSIEDMQLQMVPTNQSKRIRSANSALLPEVVFNVSYISSSTERRFAFNAAGKSLDLRLDSKFTLPASILEESISLAGQKVQAATESWHTAAANITTTDGQGESQSAKKLIGNKRLSSLLVDADFAGAVVTLQGQAPVTSAAPRITGAGAGRSGRYGQFSNEGSNTSTTLRAPGVTLKVEYRDDSTDPSMNAELKVDASTNMLHPSVVPLIMDISNSVKEVVQHKDDNVPKRPRKPTEPKHPQKFLEDENLITADPSAILGKTRLNLGLRICKQEFSLSCQPIARVAATARFEDIYLTINSIKSTEQGHFFAVSATFDHLQASVQHVYSRESTFSFDVNRVVLSVMNSKHLSGTSGISAILKIDPMRTHINARQLQDFLLFREIWIPPEVRRASKPASPAPNEGPQEYLVQRYEQVTAAAAFPWNATVSIEELAVDLDLGQAIGKPSFKIVNLWASSKKTSDWEENLCIGMERISIDSTGRTSGFVELLDSKVRTSISWPSRGEGIRRSPHIQASLGFERLSLKTSFDYQPFAVADVTTFNFLMYNVRGPHIGARDRLVVMLEGEKVQAFITTTSAAQAIALSQAFDRLISENQTAYKQSIKDIERFLRRTSSSPPTPPEGSDSETPPKQDKDQEAKTPISLHTDVVVTLSSISFGAFPSAFSDHQILLLTASDVQARFAVGLEDFKVHSGLGMTLGELSVALASINHKGPQAVSDLTVEDVVANARAARGGTILRVPKVIAAMQTWQASGSNHIDYIFKSSFEGKVDVGWNYSRISFIRNMWNTHSRALANRLGKPLPESAVKITGGGLGAIDSPTKAPGGPEESTPASPSSADSNKITAVVNVPQSRYEYTALETPVIETPQLRDMGEATPPLEWIGLHRDRLPNVTHQIVIVTLLEIVKEVEDAYARILGST